MKVLQKITSTNIFSAKVQRKSLQKPINIKYMGIKCKKNKHKTITVDVVIAPDTQFVISVDDSMKISFENNCFLIEKILTSSFPFRVKIFLLAKKLQKGIIKNKYRKSQKLERCNYATMYNIRHKQKSSFLFINNCINL